MAEPSFSSAFFTRVSEDLELSMLSHHKVWHVASALDDLEQATIIGHASATAPVQDGTLSKPWVIEPCSGTENLHKTEPTGVQNKKGPLRTLCNRSVAPILE